MSFLRPTATLAVALISFLACSHTGSHAHAESSWVKQVKQQVENESDPLAALLPRCILTRAMLECSIEQAIELAADTVEKAEKLGDPNAAAVALMLKSIALGELKGTLASNESYLRSCELFDGECCPELRSLFWVSRAKRELSVGSRKQLAELFRRARASAKESPDHMVRAIVAMELTEFRTDRISDKEFAALKQRIDAAGVPSMTWICELKKLYSEYDESKNPELYFDRVAEIASLAEEDGSLAALAFANRIQLIIHRNNRNHEEVLRAAKQLQVTGRKLGSSLYTTVGLTNEATYQLRQGDIEEARATLGEALRRCPQLSAPGVQRSTYAAHIEICIELGETQNALQSLQKLRQLNSRPGVGKPKFDSQVLRSEVGRLVAENEKAKSATILLKHEKQTALDQLSRVSKLAVTFTCCFLAGFAVVMWRNHFRMTKVNRTLRDVNTRLKAEMEVGEKNQAIRETLEQRVARVERMESLGLLAGGIAHDFNNLLVGVVCNAQILQRPGLQSDVQGRCIDGILKSAETATDLSRKMLAYAGREPCARTNVDVVSLVKSLEPIFKSAANVDVKVDFDFQLETAFAEVDQMQLEQILLNLVSNARDASGESKLPVMVRVGRETVVDVAADSALVGSRTEGDEFVFIEVQDQGVGMTAEEIAKIFEPFYRTKSTGRGMGLAVVYGLINRQDGLIRCSSEPGIGTTMRVLLPQSDAVCAEMDAVKAIPALAQQGTLVVIDDEPGILDVIARAFEPADWNVKTFSSGKEAIAYIDGNRDSIDCVLLDVVMPEMGGKTVVDRLDELGIRIPVVMMSGFSNTNLNEFLTLPNVVLTMEKPFSVSELFEKVSRATFFVAEDAVSRR